MENEQSSLANPKPDWTEGDVETQIVVPLLTQPEFLSIDLGSLKSKEFLPKFDIGKGAKTRKGYIPDYCVYLLSLPPMAVEVKAPKVDVSEAWEEATLYAHALNKRFKSSLNPCKFVLATNGLDLFAGSWDCDTPSIRVKVADLSIGSADLAELRALIGNGELERYAAIDSATVKLTNFRRPFNQGEGAAMLASKLDPNTFAADLSPILRRYFSSRDQNKDPEIYKNAYVSSNEVTSYDKILESFLVDRLSRSKSRTEIQTTKRNAEDVSKRLSEIVSNRSTVGDIQLITGGIGTGKSLFARRYKEYLQPESLRQSSHWAFLDFNFAPDDLSAANDWVCETFVKSLVEEGVPINLNDADDQERVFSADLAARDAYYQRMERVQQGRGLLEQARDIEEWRQDPVRLAHGISRHLQGERGEVLIVVFDNVDRRDVENQLAAFQLALWFMDQFRCVILLQMRDTTFEAHKDERPLDTYKTGQVFHISAPRFIDVVKRRLELSLNVLSEQAPELIKYQAPSGANISYPKERAGEFLKGIYLELFQRPTNVSRILEALAGRNVRKALDMFMSIITSGHMPEDIIAGVASGQQIRRFPEYLVLKILMRQDYRFFSESTGFVANIFYTDRNWERPSNFLIPEILFFLISRRKLNGDNGQMGFVSVARLKDHLEKFGHVRADVHKAAQYLLRKELIEGDSATATMLDDAASVKASASGWAHMRLLASRVEYVAAVLPTTPINDSALDARVFDLMQTENRHGRLAGHQKTGIVEQFQSYLRKQLDVLSSHPGYASSPTNGAKYVISKIADAVAFERSSKGPSATQIDWLDS